MRLVAGEHPCDKELSREVLAILQDEFKLEGAREVESHSKNPKGYDYASPHQKPLVIGRFGNTEARVDAGITTLSEIIGKEAVYFITHPYNHKSGVDVATTVMHARLFGEVLKQEGSAIKMLSLVVPVGAYGLNHSARRHAATGFIEGPALKMYIDDLARAGYNQIITIGSHSNAPEVEANAHNMHFWDIDPFRPESKVSSPRMGPFLFTDENTVLRDDYKAQIAKLTPFVTYLIQEFGEQKDDLCFVATDDGSQDTMGDIAYAVRGDMLKVLAFLKTRNGPGQNKLGGIKEISTVKLDRLEGKICIMADDRRLSGNTLNKVAAELKGKYKASKVVALVAHDISYDTSITEHTSVDRFVFLETNPDSAIARIDDPRIVRLPQATTALLLAGSMYHTYCTMRDLREMEKVR